jgi:hypothetical protein
MAFLGNELENQVLTLIVELVVVQTVESIVGALLGSQSL